jgi:NADH:ubiquinone oxidoreductase subunit C
MLPSQVISRVLLGYVNSLVSKIPKYIVHVQIEKNMIYLSTSESHLLSLFLFLQNHVATQYAILVDITAVDKFRGRKRFELFYFLRSVAFNNVLGIRVLTDGFSSVPSCTLVYNGAGWLEREVWDMFGIAFANHADLRRILTDYGFQGFPLRKDFPLTGFVEVRYDDETKRVIYDALELAQEFRFFDFQSPWQNSEFLRLT